MLKDIDWNWIVRTLIPIGTGLALVLGTNDFRSEGIGVILGGLSTAGLTANRTALK